jgi:glucan biosynthesis protein
MQNTVLPAAMPGALELLQLPVNDPFNQNAIALWHLPAANLSAGAAPIALDYALTWCVTACPGPKAARWRRWTVQRCM